ncbi:MAG TPA: PilT/PilU family type 4a pilus ATPase [Candidatus Limnocylindria bacterium]|nr:PilT/PilU family type 4a pilus ATPase [Candidatus Limnocylindria bacterium]
MNLETLISVAREQGASDLHLEPGLPATLRVRGALRTMGEAVSPKTLVEFARDVIGNQHWNEFLARHSFDLSKTISRVRCRINILQTSRGVGFAIRLLSTFQATVENLNLHPDLKRLVSATNGLVLMSGPTGSGKSSTMAAMIQEINLGEPRHVITLESPIEYVFRPRHAFIRQREVGRDTPSFEQALLDALREDPDVLMVGEMRDPETMRLTLNAAETGHLVLATVHSSTCIEALQRVVSAFPAEIQNAVAAQLADSLVAVIAQRLRFRADLNIRVPECEILIPNNPVKMFIRNREFFKINQVMETGAESGMWTFARYQGWLSKRTTWHLPNAGDEAPDTEPADVAPLPGAEAGRSKMAKPTVAPASEHAAPATTAQSDAPIEIEPVEGGLGAVLRKLGS